MSNCKASGPALIPGTGDAYVCLQAGPSVRQAIKRSTLGANGTRSFAYFELDGVTPVNDPVEVSCPPMVMVMGAIPTTVVCNCTCDSAAGNGGAINAATVYIYGGVRIGELPDGQYSPEGPLLPDWPSPLVAGNFTVNDGVSSIVTDGASVAGQTMVLAGPGPNGPGTGVYVITYSGVGGAGNN